MLDGRVLGASQVEYEPFGKPPLQRELGGRGGRRSREVRGIRELLAQLQVVQNEPVAVVGNAQARWRWQGHFLALRGPVALKHMRFRLTDLDGNVVRLCGSSLSLTTYN